MAIQGFVTLARGGKTALVREDGAETIAAALIEDRGCTSAGEGGRGRMARFPLPEGTGLVRKYLRGGAIRHVVSETYLVNRPLLELEVHAYVFEHGLPVPEPLGACWERRGIGYRGSLATREVAGIHLLEFMRRHGPLDEARLRRCGEAIRAMHELGVEHPDLQVRNILVDDDRCWLIDFDGARKHNVLPPFVRASNLLRLRRSFEKNGLPERDFQALCEGYGTVAFPAWLDCAYRLKGAASDLLARR